MAKGEGATVINAAVSDIRAKSFLHALSEIQQFSAIEYRTDLPDGVVPLIPQLSFPDIAFKTALMGTVYTFIATPFSMAVFEKLLPVFNTTNPTLMDNIFSFLLSCAPVLAITLLLIGVLITRFYMGRTTKKIASNFILTFTGTKIGMSFFFAIIMFFLYYSVFTDEFIVKNFNSIVTSKMVPNGVKIVAYKFALWLIDFREIIPKAIKFAVFVHIGAAAAIGLAWCYTLKRNKKIEEFRREWE